MPKISVIIILFAIFALISCKSGGTMGTGAISSSIVDTTNILQDGTVVRLTYQKQSRRELVS